MDAGRGCLEWGNPPRLRTWIARLLCARRGRSGELDDGFDLAGLALEGDGGCRGVRERGQRGEEIVIARGGRPIARLVPFAGERGPRQPGALRGRLQIADDFDAPLPQEVLAAFAGEA